VAIIIIYSHRKHLKIDYLTTKAKKSVNSSSKTVVLINLSNIVSHH
jgi:hypothetical protein